jgi:hypothetical protein
MQHETTSLLAKGAATGGSAVAAYLGVPIAGLFVMFAAALFGATASLYWRPPAAGSTVVKVLLQIFALAVSAALIAALIPYITDSKVGDVPGGIMAGLLGLVVGALYEPILEKLLRFVGRYKEGG